MGIKSVQQPLDYFYFDILLVMRESDFSHPIKILSQ